MRAFIVVLVLILPLPAAFAQNDDAALVARGPTRPVQSANLGPIQDSVVQSIHVAEGDRVRRGDVILRLLDDVQKARVGLMRASAEAEGELTQARIQAQETEAVLSRTTAAAARSAATEWEVRQARARHDAARAAIQTATDRRNVERQKLELELATLETLTIRAPFDGTVTKMDTTPGATLTRTDRPITVADLSSLEAVLYLPAAAWPRFRVGQSYRLMLSAPINTLVQGRLRNLDPVLDAASGRFRAVFVIANPNLDLPAGTEAALDLSEIAP